MKRDPKWETIITDFTALMYAKGYRGKFVLRQPHGPVEFGRNLGECLDKYSSYRDLKAAKEIPLELETDVENRINCLFRVKLDDVSGLLIKELTVKHTKTQQTRPYRGFISNRQVPGAALLNSLFPKPKPWGRWWRGRFRP